MRGLMEDKIIFKYCFFGALAGYFIFHPLVMMLSHFMSFHDIANIANFVNHLASAISKSFSPDMLTWSLSFALFNGVIGIYYAKSNQTKLAREELISKLQDALDEIKILKGILPICSSCKKIRNDEGCWQHVEEYIMEHSAADFTHGICEDCVKKLYPELYPQFKEEIIKGPSQRIDQRE
jgi:hypothetical protein